MPTSQRLELTWIGKDQQPRLEPRILIEDPGLSHVADRRRGPDDLFDNLLIQGDNLLALKALEQEYAGKVKCVFIDPPYNTGSAFAQYDDGVEHSLWLTLMRDRLARIRELLSQDGSLWITLDDNEYAYLKVVCDEIFGRNNSVATVIWQKLHARNNSAQHFSTDHDYLLVFAKDIGAWRRNKVGRTAASDADFWNPDNDPRGEWRRSDLTAAKSYADGRYVVRGPHGDEFSPREGRWWSLSRETFSELESDNRIWWGKTGRTFPFRKRFRAELGELVPTTVWLNDEVGNNREAKQESTALFGREGTFSTPKPERLLERVIHIATNPGDLVLDSFLGSGTTAAVAHKMRRRWIGIELGDHAVTHCVPRLKKVVDGTDPGGVTEQTGWTGGGGFRFCRLAPSLLERDTWGQWIISREYDAVMLARAVCKLEGFTYAPSDSIWWQHGRSTERDYLYVTTQTLTDEQLTALSHDVGPDRSLLICCAAWVGADDRWPNLTLRKLPHAVLGRCEFGRDDYSLRIAALDSAPASSADLADASAADTAADGDGDHASAPTHPAVAPARPARRRRR
jgi:adenine-specific DNA-methyltransferase